MTLNWSGGSKHYCLVLISTGRHLGSLPLIITIDVEFFKLFINLKN